jgi:hypothetical protein
MHEVYVASGSKPMETMKRNALPGDAQLRLQARHGIRISLRLSHFPPPLVLLKPVASERSQPKRKPMKDHHMNRWHLQSLMTAGALLALAHVR